MKSQLFQSGGPSFQVSNRWAGRLLTVALALAAAAGLSFVLYFAAQPPAAAAVTNGASNPASQTVPDGSFQSVSAYLAAHGIGAIIQSPAVASQTCRA